MYQTGNGSGTCANIKASGITIYTLQVNTGHDPTSTLLQNCASDSDKFFLLTQASDISSAFTAIGTNLTKLRVAQIAAPPVAKPPPATQTLIRRLRQPGVNDVA